MSEYGVPFGPYSHTFHAEEELRTVFKWKIHFENRNISCLIYSVISPIHFFVFLQEDVALQRYAQLISDFFPNLVDLEAFEVNVTNRKSYVGMIKNITRQLLKIQKNMTNVAKVICLEYSSTLILDNQLLIAEAGSRTVATSKMEPFVIIINGSMALTVITKRSILDVAAVLDPPLNCVEILLVVKE